MDEDISGESAEDIVKRGRAVNAMTETRGWRLVVRPELERQREAAVQMFVSAQTHDDFLKVQAKIAAIDYIFKLVEVVLAQGKEAMKEDK
jgi:hypothetical protein